MNTWPVDEGIAVLIFMVIFLIAYAVQRVPKEEEKIETPPPSRRSRSVPAPKKLNPYAGLKKRTGTPRVLFADDNDTKGQQTLNPRGECLPKSILDMSNVQPTERVSSEEESMHQTAFLPGGFVDRKSAALLEKFSVNKQSKDAQKKNDLGFVVPKDVVRMDSNEDTSSSEQSSDGESKKPFERKPQRVRKSIFKKTGRVVVGKHTN